MSRTACRYCQEDGPLRLLDDGDLVCKDLDGCRERLVKQTAEAETARRNLDEFMSPSRKDVLRCETCRHEACSGLGTNLVPVGDKTFIRCAECGMCLRDWDDGIRREWKSTSARPSKGVISDMQLIMFPTPREGDE